MLIHRCRIIFVTLVAAAWTTLSPLPVAAESLADLVERLTPSVVGVGAAFPSRTPTKGRPTQRLLGSGFVVSKGNQSFVITNAHVLPSDIDVDHGELLAVFSTVATGAQTRFAELVAEDRAHDLAVLRYEGAKLPAMRVSTDSARPGERIAFTGFPIGAVLGLYPATHDGIIAALTPIARPANRASQLSAAQMRRLRTPFNVYQLDAIAYPGNSGSAVYRQTDGAVVGVMNSVYVKGTRENLLSSPSGIAYAIPIEHVLELLEGIEY